VRGLRCGLPALDTEVGGFQPGVYVIYGATGMGKSTLGAWMAINMMEQTRVLILSTEMRMRFWMIRAAADLAGVNYKRLKTGKITPPQQEAMRLIFKRLNRLGDKFFMLPKSNPTPTDVLTTARRLRSEYGVDTVLVDSIQNITVPDVTDIYPKTSIAADCVLQLASEGFTMLCTSHTGRNAKNRNTKAPQINDAEGSGKIEQNADFVLGLYRRGYYVERKMLDPLDHWPDDRTWLMNLKDRTGTAGAIIPAQFIPGQGYILDERH
jgi:replicative DNA helicase